jgi:hypothetical protein
LTLRDERTNTRSEHAHENRHSKKQRALKRRHAVFWSATKVIRPTDQHEWRGEDCRQDRDDVNEIERLHDQREGAQPLLAAASDAAELNVEVI